MASELKPLVYSKFCNAFFPQPSFRILRVRIAIAGPGRSGSSLLVLLFHEWGFSTPPPDDHWFETAQAGLESRIDAHSPYEIDKDPWAYQYLGELPAGVLETYDAFIVPIRDRADASLSRIVQERLHRARISESDSWRRDASGSVPGGAIYQTSQEAISATLEAGLWDLLEIVTRSGIQPIVLHFPRFAEDFDYLWLQISALVSSRIDEDSARTVWNQVVDPHKIRLRSTNDASTLKERELQALVEGLHQDLHSQQVTLDQAVAQRDEALRELDAALQSTSSIQTSRIWRSTRWWRSLRQTLPHQDV